MELRFEKYNPKHEKEVLSLFDSNTPTYFAAIERNDFVNFLKQAQEVYETVCLGDDLVAAGGYRTEKEDDARIVWVMVDDRHHGKGIGKTMMLRQMKMIEESNKFKKISLMTSQLTDEFYHKLGFETTLFKEDFWDKGLHLVHMEKVV